jgi:F-type H+-transporting ATPase subunit c
MVQAAKLISAGSALIALAGVGAGIGIVFGALIQAASRNPTMANGKWQKLRWDMLFLDLHFVKV